MTNHRCPPPEELSQWMDGELTSDRQSTIEEHLLTCDSCRDETAGWLEMEPLGSGLTPECPDPERLTAYVCGELSDAAMQALRPHISECAYCSDEVEQMASLPDPIEEPQSVESSRWIEIIARVRQWRHSFALPPMPVVAVATILLVGTFALQRNSFSPKTEDGAPYRNAEKTAEQIAEVRGYAVDLRTGPGMIGEVVSRLENGQRVNVLDTVDDWLKVETMGEQIQTGWIPAAAARVLTRE